MRKRSQDVFHQSPDNEHDDSTFWTTFTVLGTDSYFQNVINFILK